MPDTATVNDYTTQYPTNVLTWTDLAAAWPTLTPAQLEDPEVHRWYETALAPTYYRQNRQVTNFAYFLASSRAESRPATVAETFTSTAGAARVGDGPQQSDGRILR